MVMGDAGINVDAKEVFGKGGSITTKHQGAVRRPVETVVAERVDSSVTGTSAKLPAEAPMVNSAFLNQAQDKKKK